MTGLLSRVGVLLVPLMDHIAVRAGRGTAGVTVPAAASTMHPADIRRSGVATRCGKNWIRRKTLLLGPWIGSDDRPDNESERADGDVRAAERELRKAHAVFVRLGAEFELRALGPRLPPRTALQGAGALTGRELEIARAGARRLSTKEIGAQHDISARTVSTHLSHIFEKLGVESRGELADVVRDSPLLEGA